MYALVDAVSFYASAEKVFDPSIRNKPVVVLTNNDGCICAVCPIARRLGIPKFKPYFQIKYFLEKHGVVVRSSNYELYADLSERMMNVIARYCDNQYIYSIDESFLEFKNYGNLIGDWHKYGHEIRKAIWKETRLPVGVGFGTTPTLAKAANHAAKKLTGFNGVAVIDSNQTSRPILKRMSVTDVWGIGNRLGKKLNLLGINTADQLMQQSAKEMRRQFSVVVERTVNELNGITCLSWDEVRAPKQEIFSTRSFGQRITDHQALMFALVTHGSIVGRKLRQQHSLVKRLMIFASSSPHENQYYKKSIVYEFPVATDSSSQIASAISIVLQDIFQIGVYFYRCGVGAISLESQQYQQPDFFTPSQPSPLIMNCFDKINQRYGQGAVTLASEGRAEKWQMRRSLLSPQYTSRWRDIPKISC
ncbi:Y-family DNA polymerase [Colwellia sp. 20A7]|uniref:Y-family DNA polymerase n=1 Tax=Colwellia sp. 20A7 TaxID=2689569 RepID=UPI00135B532A|nr:Y-family DNA polymerase [Colwellia sp. 20A7]